MELPVIDLDGKTVDVDAPTKRPFTVAVDFDGVVAQYDGWKGEDHYGDPMSGVRDALIRIHGMGYRIIVFTTRGDTDGLREYFRKHRLPFDFINENPDQPSGSSGKIVADVYLDDRALRFVDWTSALAGILAIGG